MSCKTLLASGLGKVEEKSFTANSFFQLHITVHNSRYDMNITITVTKFMLCGLLTIQNFAGHNMVVTAFSGEKCPEKPKTIYLNTSYNGINLFLSFENWSKLMSPTNSSTSLIASRASCG